MWLAALLALGALGCADPPPIAELALVTTRPDVVRPEILRQDVEGEWCFSQNVVRVSLRPPWRARLADHGRAIARAIDSVPGVDVLVNVDVRVRVEQYLLFQRICAVVRGDAGRIP
jgi:hypothetical protein